MHNEIVIDYQHIHVNFRRSDIFTNDLLACAPLSDNIGLTRIPDLLRYLFNMSKQ